MEAIRRFNLSRCPSLNDISLCVSGQIIGALCRSLKTGTVEENKDTDSSKQFIISQQDFVFLMQSS